MCQERLEKVRELYLEFQHSEDEQLLLELEQLAPASTAACLTLAKVRLYGEESPLFSLREGGGILCAFTLTYLRKNVGASTVKVATHLLWLGPGGAGRVRAAAGWFCRLLCNSPLHSLRTVPCKAMGYLASCVSSHSTMFLPPERFLGTVPWMCCSLGPADGWWGEWLRGCFGAVL